MQKFKATFSNELNEKIVHTVQKLVDEYTFYIGSQKIRIRIYQDENEKYGYSLSHYYYSSKQLDPYIPSKQNGFTSPEEALDIARYGLILYYVPDDSQAKWVENALF